MDLVTSMIGIMGMLLFLYPIIYIHWKKKKANNNLLKLYLHEAQNRNLDITENEVWAGLYVIGIDKQQKKLLYLKKSDQLTWVEIDLFTIKNCNAHKLKKHNNASDYTINKLDLRLQNASKEYSLEIYNADSYLTISTELAILTKWETEIKKHF